MLDQEKIIQELESLDAGKLSKVYAFFDCVAKNYYSLFCVADNDDVAKRQLSVMIAKLVNDNNINSLRVLKDCLLVEVKDKFRPVDVDVAKVIEISAGVKKDDVK